VIAADDLALPSDIYAERVLVGSLLLRGERFCEFRDVLTAGDLTTEKNKTVWSAFCRCQESGTPIDRATVYSALTPAERERVGGISGLLDLDDQMPEIIHLEAYAAAVRDAAIKRRLVVAAANIQAQAALPGTTAAGLIETARKAIAGVAGGAGPSGEFASPVEIIDAAGGLDGYMRLCQITGIPLPWPKVQRAVIGLQPGDLAIVAGTTGRGKTAFAVNLALHAARSGCGVAFFSLEMTRRQVLNRLMSLVGFFNSRVFRQQEPLTVVQERDILHAAGEVGELPVWIRDSAALTVSGLIGGIQRLRAKRDVRLVVVDYLQLVTGEGRSRVEQVGSVARGLKNAALELSIPIVALSQFNRDSSKTKAVPELHDLKESSEIEQAANLALFLHGETHYQSAPNELLPIDLLVAKQRDGAADLKIEMLFRPDCGLFVEAA